MKTLGRVYLALAILMAIVGLIQAVRSAQHFGTINPIFLLFSLLPAIVLAAAFAASRKPQDDLVRLPSLLNVAGANRRVVPKILGEEDKGVFRRESERSH